MSCSSCVRIGLLTPEGFDAHCEQRSAGITSTAGLRLAAVAAGTCFADELPGARGDAAAQHAIELEYRGRFCYRWVVVDLGHAAPAARADLAAAFARIDPGRGGLLLSDQDYGDLPDHVHTLARVLPDDARVREPWYLLQLCRFFLNALGPTRLLFLDLRDAALLAEPAALHAAAILVTSAQADAAPRTAVGSFARVDEVLAWLRSGGGVPRLSDVSDRAFAEGAAAALDAARTLVLGDADTAELDVLLRRCPTQGFVSAGPGALSAVLAPDGTLPVRPKAPPGELRVVVHEVTDRNAQAASIRACFACLHLLGDLLAATPVLRAYHRSHPDAHITLVLPDTAYARVLTLCPSVDRLVYVPVEHEQIVYGSSTEFAQQLPFFGSDCDERFVLDIQTVARHPDARGLHMSEGYARLAGVEIASRRPAIDADRARAGRRELGLPARYAVLVRHTVSGAHIGPGHVHSKRWQENKWIALARALARDHGLAVVSIGTPEERRLENRHAIDLHCLSILDVAALLADAALVVSVDNGIYHLAQGVGVPTVHLYPAWLDRNWVASDPVGPSIDIHEDLRRLPVSRVLEACTRLLGGTPAAPMRRVGAKRARTRTG